MGKAVIAEGALLARLIASQASSCSDLSCEAFGKFEAAQAQTAWARHHRRRFALMEGDDVLASAEQYDLSGVVDQQPVTICGLASVFTIDGDNASDHAEDLIEGLVAAASDAGTDLALVFNPAASASPWMKHFQVVPTVDTVLTVTESLRHGAPMTLVRGGEDRDLQAIAAMGKVLARRFRFHLDRDSDFIKHVITRKRLIAGLGLKGRRQLEFVIAEEGITAAAYLVMSVANGTWTIEECGDRDPSGARLGAILQALIAREPAEARPLIRGWLPPGFLPPQVKAAATTEASPVLFVRALSSRIARLQVSVPDVMYWRNDLL